MSASAPGLDTTSDATSETASDTAREPGRDTLDVAAAAAQLRVLVGVGGVLVLTGAGLSTESGIPDYRGPDGTRRVTPMQYAEFSGSSEARRRYWARSYIGWQRFSKAVPNDGHRAVAALQRAGLVEGVVTQNVDGLHQRAGAKDVVELHGSLDCVVCLTCGDLSRREDLHERLHAANPGFTELALGLGGSPAADGSQVSSQIRPDGDIVLGDAVTDLFHLPRCLVCRADTLKPDVVFFGESVPRATVAHCFDLLGQAQSLLVLGSSLAVMSGYRFVRRAARDGIPVAIVTASASRGDPEATLRVHTPLGATLRALVDGLAGD